MGLVLMLLSDSNSTRFGLITTLRPFTSRRCSAMMRRTVSYKDWSYAEARVIETFEGPAGIRRVQPVRPAAPTAAIVKNSRLVTSIFMNQTQNEELRPLI